MPNEYQGDGPRPVDVDTCLICEKRKAQPENGICRKCERAPKRWAHDLALILVLAVVVGALTGCKPNETIVPVEGGGTYVWRGYPPYAPKGPVKRVFNEFGQVTGYVEVEAKK